MPISSIALCSAGVVQTVPPQDNSDVARLASAGFPLSAAVYALTIAAVNGVVSFQYSPDQGSTWLPCVSDAGAQMQGLGNGTVAFTPQRQGNQPLSPIFRFVGSGGSMNAALSKTTS